MYHFRYNVQGWPEGVKKLPPNYSIKAVDNVQLLAEAKAINPGIVRILRHFTSPQVPGSTYQASRTIADNWFKTFIDGTFLNGSTAGVAHKTTEYIEDWNEYAWFVSQTVEEKLIWTNWALAALDVWYEKYWPMFGTNLCVGNIPIGNDCDIRVAERVAQLTNVSQGKILRIGYHSYWPVKNNVIPGITDGGEWKYYSGRWTTKDQQFKAAGFTIHWALTEAGAVGYHGVWPGIGLNPDDGWLKNDVHGGNITQYKISLAYFMDRWALWNRQNGHRCLSPNLFDSFGVDAGSWTTFQILQPNITLIADFVSQLYFPQKPSTLPTIPPPTPPPPSGCPGTPRTQYERVYNVVNQNVTLERAVEIFTDAWKRSKETVGGSFDDAGIGDLKKIRVNVHDHPVDQQGAIKAWFKENYPLVTTVEFYNKSFKFERLPIAENITITQKFGEHPENYSQFGLPGHDGVDMVRASGETEGAPVMLPADGTIYRVHNIAIDGAHNYGNHVRAEHAGGYKTIFAHLSETIPEVQVGDFLPAGTWVGYVGNTGNSFGAHLHLGMKRAPGAQGWPYDLIDPWPFMQHLI